MEFQIVLLGLLIYVLYVLIPLIPAVIIYKLFPDTTVGASGFLGNLKINATGAFGAYVIVVILGHFIIKDNLNMLNKLDSTAWEIKSKVNFVNCDNQLLNGFNDQDVRSQLIIKSTPDYSQKALSGIVFMAYVRGELPKVTFSYPGFESKMVDLQHDSVLIRDYSVRKIDIGQVNLMKCDQQYEFEPIPLQIEPTTTDTMGSNLDPVPDTTGGPPILNQP